VEGKILEKILINRIMHYVYGNNLLTNNQFGFTPKKSATDAALAVKEYLEGGMTEGHIAIRISLNVRDVFDTAWWPSILKTLKEFNCTKTLYNLVKS